jgi:phage terminase large subunit GpA-like protein
MSVESLRDDNGKLPAYAWPGGYPIYYLASDNAMLCPKCANEYKPERDNESQLKPVAYGINWEDAQLFCENCNARIESAYADGGDTQEVSS